MAIKSLITPLTLLVLVASAAASRSLLNDKGNNQGQDNDHQGNNQGQCQGPASPSVTFAVFGDWGRRGGAGSENFAPTSYDPKANGVCPPSQSTPFYVTIDSSDALKSGADNQCVRDACGKLVGDERENCVGTVQQLQAAWFLNQACVKKNCQFIINTSDNFYALGCNRTENSAGGTCGERFADSWTGVYQTDAQPALKNLVWYNSLGNHDVLGGIEGVNAQIAYTLVDSRWYLPSRYYATRIGCGPTQINLVVADTSSFIDGYLTPSSDYSKIDEEQVQSTANARAEQLAFLDHALNKAMQQPGWTVLLGHHPAFSGDESYFQEDNTGKSESSAWGTLANLVKKYKPHVYVCGHDHVISHSSAAGYVTQFFVSGAGSFTEPNDGGWDTTTGQAKTGKPYLKYSNVRMKNGQSFVGNIIMTATADQLTTEMYSIDTGLDPQYTVTCDKNYDCQNKIGNNPGFTQP